MIDTRAPGSRLVAVGTVVVGSVAAALGCLAWGSQPGDPLMLIALLLLTVTGPVLRSLRLISRRATIQWATPFALTTLVLFGAPWAIGFALPVVLVAATMAFRNLWTTAFYAGRAGLALGLGGVITSAIHPGALGPAQDLVIAAVVAAVVIVVSFVLEGVWWASTGQPFLTVMHELAVADGLPKLAQIAVTPLVTVVVHVAPLMSWILLAPSLAVHFSADNRRRHMWDRRNDPITNLPNRRQLNLLMDKALTDPGQRRIALVLLDINAFRAVNDRLGHEVGDEVLAGVGLRLLTEFGEESLTIARAGGDEFALLFEVEDEQAAVQLAQQVNATMNESYLHGAEQISVAAGVGLALGPEHGATGPDLFAAADRAMSLSKRDRTGVAVFDPAGDTVTITRNGVVGSLRRAVDDNELVLQYQPKVSLSTRRITGVEALVRWEHPSGEIVYPDNFIPAAERTGLMPLLTDAILEIALSELRGWRRAGFEVPIAVNVTTTDLLEPQFVENLQKKLLHHRIPPSQLTLEITERVLADDLVTARAVMVRLNRLGIRLAMDDFGTGWSSLLMLRSLPVSEVKLDRSFVSRAVESDMDRTIVSKVAELSHALELIVVAEGVENEQVMQRLVRLGCDEAQGYYLAMPMPAAQVMTWAAGYLADEGLSAIVPRQNSVSPDSAASAAAALATLADPGFNLPGTPHEVLRSRAADLPS